MSIDAVLAELDGDESVIESYVLVRELRLVLEVGHDFFHPIVKIKVYRSNALPATPFHFNVSHYVHTPEQAAPYMTSRTSDDSEAAAIRRAISTTTSFLKMAIRNGHEPQESWLVANKDF